MQAGGTICFNISGSGAHTITPASALPTITAASTTIDGTTQPGYTGAPLIEINGANAGSTPGIIVSASGVTIKGLVVNRFNSDGIYLAAGGNTTVQANYVGTDPTGTIARGNTHSGIGMQTAGNHIGGTTAAERNLVSGNLQSGIAVNGSSSTGNVISGNYVGTDVTGTFAITNGGDGVLVTAAPNTTVGGTTGVTPGGACTGACNLLSGNAANGAGISGSTATGNVVAGNYIGTDVNGLYPIGNYDIGVEAQDAPSNTIGGTTPASRNVIGGNVGAGVSLTGSAAANNSVTGNYIGTDRSGNGSMPNHKMGINIGSPSGGSNNAHNNNIGGTTGVTPGGACTGACNVIVSSFWSGIYISGASGGSNTIAGNFIGVTANGFNAGGNVQDGIGIVDSPGNIIGGSSAAQRNLISGNGGSGVALVGASTGGNHIEGNYIGQRTDQGDMPNAGSGVAIANGVTTAVVGNKPILSSTKLVMPSPPAVAAIAARTCCFLAGATSRRQRSRN